MAELPDLDPNEIGTISWWNALEHGATSLDPLDALEYGNIDSWEPYDNGIDATLTTYSEFSIYLRLKTDGWIVVWTDPAADGGPEFPWLLKGRGSGGLDPLPPASRLSDEIEAVLNAMGNPGNYAVEDVGLYCYDAADSDHIAIFSSSGPTGTIARLDTADMKQWFTVGWAWGERSRHIHYPSYWWEDSRRIVYFDGTEVADSGWTGETYDWIDGSEVATENGTMYDFTYDHQIDDETDGNDVPSATSEGSGFHLIFYNEVE